MSITDPASFIEDMDAAFFRNYQRAPAQTSHSPAAVKYVEPRVGAQASAAARPSTTSNTDEASEESPSNAGRIESKVVVLEDFIDTDALAPNEFLTTCRTAEEFGAHVLEFTHPEFRSKVGGGQKVVVAGKAFGCGSSRDVAVTALIGAGVQAVIAKSFAFIYGRNQPSLGLLGIVMSDDEFYAAATDGEEILIDVPTRTIVVGGQKEFKFNMAEMEYRLTVNKGISESYKMYGKAIWEKLTESDTSVKVGNDEDGKVVDKRIEW